jgi:hypothetical protein
VSGHPAGALGNGMRFAVGRPHARPAA